MRGMDIHAADVVARVRARLAALVRRARAQALQRLAGLMPRVPSGIDAAEAAAYEAASREAFRAATTLESAMPLTHGPRGGPPPPGSGRPAASVPAPSALTAGPTIPAGTQPADSPAPGSWAPRPVAPVSARISRAAEPAAPATPRRAIPVTPKPGAARPVASVSAPTARAASPVANAAPKPVAAAAAAATGKDPAPQAVAGERPTRRSRRQAGETPLDHLMRTPTDVDSPANDFFDGLARDVESDR